MSTREHQPAFEIPGSWFSAQMCPDVSGGWLSVLVLLEEDRGQISPSTPCPEVVGDIQIVPILWKTTKTLG